MADKTPPYIFISPWTDPQREFVCLLKLHGYDDNTWLAIASTLNLRFENETGPHELFGVDEVRECYEGMVKYRHPVLERVRDMDAESPRGKVRRFLRQWDGMCVELKALK